MFNDCLSLLPNFYFACFFLCTNMVLLVVVMVVWLSFFTMSTIHKESGCLQIKKKVLWSYMVVYKLINNLFHVFTGCLLNHVRGWESWRDQMLKILDCNPEMLSKLLLEMNDLFDRMENLTAQFGFTIKKELLPWEFLHLLHGRAASWMPVHLSF